jgi:hypothetical protein
LFFELLLELRIGLLEVAEVIFEEPHVSSPLLLQLVKFSQEKNVLCQLFGYAFFLGSELLVATHDCFQFLDLFL